jgi:acyl transferase domain-containing protein
MGSANDTEQTNVKGGHFLTEDVSCFDAAFFNLSSETAAVRMAMFPRDLNGHLTYGRY